MDTFKKQNEKANDILTNYRGKVLAIVKATRAGATTSLLKRACELGQKTVIVAPYIEIFATTINDVTKLVPREKPRIARIASNEEICKRIADKISGNAQLEAMVFHLRPSCVNCEYNDPECCKLQEILASDWDVLGLTYAKLKALSISESTTATDLLKKIKLPDNLIFDEFVTGIIDAFLSFEIVEPHAYLEREFNYENERDRIDAGAFETIFWAAIGNLALVTEIEGKKLAEGEERYFESPIKADVETFFKDNFAKCWNLIERLTFERKKTELLQQLVQIASAERFYIMKKQGKISIKPVLDINDISRGSVYIKSFIRNFLKKDKLVALVDACLPDLDLSASLGKTVETYPWGDPLDTNRSQIVICDTKKISKTDFFKDVKRQIEVKKAIDSLSRHHGACNVIVAAQGSGICNVMKIWQKKGEIDKQLLLTYYRSDISRGVKTPGKRRILILLGGPYLPNEAYTPETYIKTGQAKDLQAEFKKTDMKSTFINMIGRVKDPESKEKSIVYAAGITATEVRAFLKQEEIQPPMICQFLFTGADATDFALAGDLFLSSSELTDKWNDLEKELPVLVRILKVCRLRDEPLTPSDIASGQEHTQRVTLFIESYSDVLKKLNIEIIKKGKSIRLQTL